MKRGIITISKVGAVTVPTAPVWMTKFEIADLFGVFAYDIRKTIRQIYKSGELQEHETMKYIRQDDGTNYDVYSLEMVIALAFKLRSKEAIAFRGFVTNRLYAKSSENNSISLFLSYGNFARQGKYGEFN